MKDFEVYNEIEKEIKNISSSLEEFATTKKEVEKLKEELFTIKMLQNNKVVKDAKKEMLEYFKKAITTSSNAQYTIPVEVVSQVQMLTNVYGFARRISNVITVGSNTVKVPVESDVSVYWTDEGTDIQETNQIFSTGLNITTKKLAGYVELSKELVKYSNVNLIDYILTVFSKKIAFEEDKTFLLGSGSLFTGIRDLTPSTVKVSNATDYQNVTIEEIIELTGLVDQSVYESEEAVFIMSHLLYNSLLTKKSTTGEYISYTFIDPSQRTILGRKVILTNIMPTTGVVAIFGDFKQSNIFAVSEEMTLETSTDYGFRRDVVSVKITERISPVNVGLLSGFTYLRLAQSSN